MKNPNHNPKLKAHPALCSSAVLGGWIAMTDKLPPYDEPVLVFQPNWEGQLVTLAEFVCTDGSGHKFRFDLQKSQYDRCDNRYSVTHWMRLPNPPNDPKLSHDDREPANSTKQNNEKSKS